MVVFIKLTVAFARYKLLLSLKKKSRIQSRNHYRFSDMTVGFFVVFFFGFMTNRTDFSTCNLCFRKIKALFVKKRSSSINVYLRLLFHFINKMETGTRRKRLLFSQYACRF